MTAPGRQDEREGSTGRRFLVLTRLFGLVLIGAGDSGQTPQTINEDQANRARERSPLPAVPIHQVGQPHGDQSGNGNDEELDDGV